MRDYSTVPIRFDVREILELGNVRDAPDPRAIRSRGVEVPYVKDYDADTSNRPESWQQRFDLRNWGFFAARAGGERVGGAAVAFRTPGLEMLEARDDLAVLWDLRVAPTARRRGVGARLLRSVEDWCARRGVRWLGVETQNVNVPAFRFYTGHGFVLKNVVHGAYVEHPDEIQLVLEKSVSGKQFG